MKPSVLIVPLLLLLMIGCRGQSPAQDGDRSTQPPHSDSLSSQRDEDPSGDDSEKVKAAYDVFYEAKEFGKSVSPSDSFQTQHASLQCTITSKGVGKCKSGKESYEVKISSNMGEYDYIDDLYYSVSESGDKMMLFEKKELPDPETGIIAVRLNEGEGQPSWSTRIPAFNLGPPIATDSVLYVTGIGTLAALDVETGKKIWMHQRLYDPESRPFTFNSFGVPRLENDVVVFEDSKDDRYKISVSRETGEIVSNTASGTKDTESKRQRDSEPPDNDSLAGTFYDATPFGPSPHAYRDSFRVDHRLARCIVSNEGNGHCVAGEDSVGVKLDIGLPYNRLEIGKMQYAIFDGSMLFVCELGVQDVRKTKIFSMNLESGSVTWSDKLSTLNANPTLGDSVMYVSGLGVLVAYNPRSGEKMWHHDGFYDGGETFLMFEDPLFDEGNIIFADYVSSDSKIVVNAETGDIVEVVSSGE